MAGRRGFNRLLRGCLIALGIPLPCTHLQKLCRKHGITRWPYRGLKAQATAALSHTPGSGVQAGGVATQAAAAAQLPALLLSQPGTPTAWARCPARAGAGASPSPFLLSASPTAGPAIDTAGSGSSSMLLLRGSGNMFLLRGSGTCEGSGPMPALQRCYTPFTATTGGSGPSFDQQLGQPAAGLAAPAAHGSPRRDSGTIAPSASAACLKSLLKRAAALAGEETLLQVSGAGFRARQSACVWVRLAGFISAAANSGSLANARPT